MPRTVPVSEAARMLGLTHQQVLNRIYRGKLKAKKEDWCWRVYLSSIRAELREPQHDLS
jgi:hypothetical protein